MDFRDLKYVITVADCGSVTDAAKALFISQPSLSYTIAKIEQDLGVQLFHRKNYPLTLTYAGEKYVETARQILLLNDNLRRELVDIGLGEKGQITFGLPTERAGYMLPRVIPEYKKLFPKVDVRIYEAGSDDLQTALTRNEINFYIIPRDLEDLPNGFQTEFIYQEALHLVAAPGAVKQSDLKNPAMRLISDDFLASQPFIQIKRGHAIRQKTDAIFRSKHITPQVCMEVSSCISAVQLAHSGLGITIIPQRAIEALGGEDCFCCYRYAPQNDFWDVNVVYKSDAYLDRAERGFIEMLKRQFL